MACVQARYSRRLLHDHSRQCPCPTHSSYRAHPESSTTTAPPWTAHRLLREAFLEGAGSHDRKEAAHRVGELLAVLDEPTPEMRMVRELLCEEGHFPTRRTFERRLKALPERLPDRIGCLGRHLVEVLKPWERVGEGRWPSTVPLCRRKAGCGTRRTGREASCLTPP